MKQEDKEKDEEMEEARELLIDGLGKMIRATVKVSKEIVKSFKEGYSGKDRGRKEKANP